MKVLVDLDRCTGIGICESLADDYFEVGDDGEVVLKRDGVLDEDLVRVREAVEGCPTRALRLQA